MCGANIPPRKSYLNLLFSFCSFGGGSEMMRDGDVLELVPTMERAQKYDSEIFKWLASFLQD